MRKFLTLSFLAVFFTTGCGDSLSGLVNAAKDAGIDSSATIADQEKAEAVFEGAFASVFDAVGQATSQAAGGPVSKMTPSQAASQSLEVNTTVDADPSGTVTINGVIDVNATQDGTVTQKMDIVVSWSAVPVSANGEVIETSGKIVFDGDLTVSGQSVQGTISQVGQITIPDGTFGFDILITISDSTISYSGNINGKDVSEEINLEDFGGGDNGQDDGDDQGSEPLEVSTGDCPAVPDEGTMCLDYDGATVTGVVSGGAVELAGLARVTFYDPANPVTAYIQIQFPPDTEEGLATLQDDGANVFCFEEVCDDDRAPVATSPTDQVSIQFDSVGTETGDTVKGKFTVKGSLLGDEYEYKGSFNGVLE